MDSAMTSFGVDFAMVALKARLKKSNLDIQDFGPKNLRWFNSCDFVKALALSQASAIDVLVATTSIS